MKQSQFAARAQAIPSTAARPFLKFAGGKTALLSEILPRLPNKINTYYEPFVGGGAVFFALAAEKRFECAVIGDVNKELMGTYAAIAQYVDKIVVYLGAHTKQHSEDHYYKVRKNADCLSHWMRAARMIYLNRTCFNGLYRVNKSGRFNVPFGNYKNPTICDEENLRAVSFALHRRGIDIAGSDFEVTVARAKKGDAVYMDPPYVPASATANFTAYSAGGFGLEEQVRLRDVAARLVKKGVHVLLSNSDTPLVRNLYCEFKLEKVEAPRRINSKGGKRGNVGELLISGKR